MALRDEIRAEQSKLKDKPFKDKWNYFWDYYKIHVIVGICLIFFVGTLIRDVLNNKPYAFYGVLLNATSYTDMDTYEEAFGEILGVDLQEYDVIIDNTTNVSQDNYSELTVASVEKIMASVAAGEIDVFVSDQDTIRQYGYNDTLMDLRNILSTEMLEKYADRLLYIDMVDVRLQEQKSMDIFADTETEDAASDLAGAEDGMVTADSESAEETDLYAMLYTDPSGMAEPVPVGIYLEDAPILTETQSYLNCTPVFSVLINTKHPAYAVQFLNYLDGAEPLTEDEIFAIESKAALLN